MSKTRRDSIEQLLSETRLTVTQLAKEQDVSVPTVWRWVTAGVDGHLLSSFKLGGKKRYTTREAFARWVAIINGEQLSVRHLSKRRRIEIRSAEKRVERAGVK